MLSDTIQKHYKTLAMAERCLQDGIVKVEQLQRKLEQQTRECDAQEDVISSLEDQRNMLLEKRKICLDQADQLHRQIEEFSKKIIEDHDSLSLIHICPDYTITGAFCGRFFLNLTYI